MHYNFVDKTGRTYGNLNVVGFSHREGSKMYFKCRCTCGNICLKLSSNLKSNISNNASCGCLLNIQKRLTEEEMLIALKSNFSFDVVQLGKTVRSKCKFYCKEHGIFEAVYQNAVRGQNGCPGCALHGFKRNLKAAFYINAVLDRADNIVAIKYGITNVSVESRANQIEKHSQFKVRNIISWESDGDSIRDLETIVKTIFGGKYLSKSELPSGYTETLPVWKAPSLIKFIQKLYKE